MMAFDLRMRMVVVAVVLCIGTGVMAVEPAERLADPLLEARARMISTGLRCLVCQNETIDDSHADLARDIRTFVRYRLTKGDSDAAVKAAVVDRFGEFVLLNPPVRRATWLLWFGPLLMVVAGSAAIALWLRRTRAAGGPIEGPLTEAERLRLDRLTGEDRL